ncbi:MAG: extracellular solute-binding protein [Defluviitaleaceae bacterium]|nr:extracellular solute-binding protein [Defluviitaleaceae bacterium]
MKKALIFVLLLTAMLVIAACGRNNEEATPDPTPAATPDPTAAPDTNANEESDPEPTGSILPWTGDPITFTFFAFDVGVNEPEDAYGAQLLREKLGNITINWDVPTQADYNTRVNLYWAGGGIPDVMWVNRSNSWDQLAQYSGMLLDFYPLLEYMPNFMAAAADAPWALRYINTNGQLTNIPNLENDAIPEAWFANMDVLNRYGIEMPTTLAEMEEAMEALREANPDIIPFQTYGWGLGYYVDTMSLILGSPFPAARRFFCHENNVWDHHLLNNTGSSRYREVIELLADWRERGFLHPEFMTLSGDEVQVIMASGNWAFTYAWAEQLTAWFNLGHRDEWPFDIQWMPNPQPEAGVAPFANARVMGDNVWWGFVARHDVQHPEVLAAVIDLVYSYEIATAFQWGQEGVSFRYNADGIKEWIPEFLEAGQDARNDLGIWNLMLPRYATLRDDTALMRGFHDEAQRAIRGVTQAVLRGDIRVDYVPFDPILTEREREDAAFIRSSSNTVQDEWVAQMVAGIRPISDFDAMIEAVLAVANLQEYMDIWNSGEPLPTRPTSAERNFIYP